MEVQERRVDKSIFNNNTEHQEMIQMYLALDDRIKKIQFQQFRLKYWFDQQSFVHSSMAYDMNGIGYVHYPSFDQVVIDYVDTQDTLKNLEKALRTKQRRFEDITCNLSKVQLESLREPNMDPLLEKDLIKNIKKIEKNINYKYRF
ncbi:MAG: hypothetical protein ABF790_01385 [Liquorilactobacillus nagelii]